MIRERYAPGPVDGNAVGVSPFPATAAVRGGVVPWLVGEAAANSMPPPAAPAPDVAAEIMAAAHREGLAAGRAEAEAEFAELHARFVADAQDSLAALADVRASIVERCRTELGELALAVAEAVLQRELIDGRAVLEGFVRQALVEMDPHQKCTLSVTPQDAAALTQWAQSGWPAAVVRGDPALRPGELRVDAACGRIEVSHAKRIERIRRLVLGEADQP